MDESSLHIYIAGMPSFSLTDLAKMRLEVISFFLVGYLLCALLLKFVWNYLAKDFKWMPTVGFGRSLAMLVVSGLFLYVVLTMISGARELMTPGAWVKKGAIYELSEHKDEFQLGSRREALDNLGRQLLVYASENDGRIPERRFDPALTVHTWMTGDDPGLPFEYFGNQILDGSQESNGSIIAFEPITAPSDRFVLFGDGRVELLDWRTLSELAATRSFYKQESDE